MSKVEGIGPLTPLMSSCNFFRLMPSRVNKQNLNAWLLQQHFWSGLMAKFRVAVLYALSSQSWSVVGEIRTALNI